eukprot:gene23867-28952_t
MVPEDDVEEVINSGQLFFTSPDLEFGYDSFTSSCQNIGLRFQNLLVPQGVRITAAVLSFTAEVDGPDQPIEMVIELAASEDCPSFRGESYYLTTISVFESSVSWTSEPWTAGRTSSSSVDLAELFQELVNQLGWKAGNAVCVRVSPKFKCASFDGRDIHYEAIAADNQGGATKLFVSWHNCTWSPPPYIASPPPPISPPAPPAPPSDAKSAYVYTSNLAEVQLAAAMGNPVIENVILLTDVALSTTLPNVTRPLRVLGRCAGARCTVDGGGQVRLFFVAEGCMLTLENLTLANGYAPGRGGAVEALPGSKLVLHLVIFVNNSADQYGGAVFVDESIVDVQDCRFSSNTAYYGGGGLSVLSNAFSTHSLIHIEGSVFEGNKVGEITVALSGQGAALSLYRTDATISNSRFFGNWAALNSGAVVVKYNSSVHIYSSNVEENVAESEGGGLRLVDARCCIHESRFASNGVSLASTSTPFSEGGAIYMREKVSLLLNASLFLNHSADMGAAVAGCFEQLCDLTILGSRLVGGVAMEGGVVSLGATSLHVSASVFSQNHAWVSGGAIYSDLDEANITISASNLSSNSAGELGGAVLTCGASLTTLDASQLSGNSAGRSGGAVHSEAGAVVRLSGCSITRNDAVDGGSIFVSDGQLAMSECWMANNSATTGGAIRATAATVLVAGSVARHNNASSNGGVVAMTQGGALQLLRSDVSSNMAFGDGGVVYAQGGWPSEGGKVNSDLGAILIDATMLE